MKAHGFEMEGPFIGEILPTLPEWTSDDEGREIYVEDEEKRYYADGTSWVNYETLAGTSGTSGTSGVTGTSGTGGTSGSSGTSAAGSIAISTDNKMARYNGTSGIQGTGVSVSDTDDIVLPATSSLKCPEKLVIPLNEPTSLENGCIWIV